MSSLQKTMNSETASDQNKVHWKTSLDQTCSRPLSRKVPKGLRKSKVRLKFLTDYGIRANGEDMCTRRWFEQRSPGFGHVRLGRFIRFKTYKNIATVS